jgi:hypothetical protein
MFQGFFMILLSLLSQFHHYKRGIYGLNFFVVVDIDEIMPFRIDEIDPFKNNTIPT